MNFRPNLFRGSARLGLRLVYAFLLAGVLLVTSAWSQSPIIWEFRAANSKGPGPEVRDEDDDASDWMLIYNPSSTERLNLEGWFLTNDPLFLPKWRFPSHWIENGRSIRVFASGKNRLGTESDDDLHTNFDLDNESGYLALVSPDGTTVVQEFADYPRQRRRASFGLPFGPEYPPNYFFRNSPIVSEVQYHPAPPPDDSPFEADDFEFIELTSTLVVTQSMYVRLDGPVEFAKTVTFPPSQSVLLVANQAAFESRYGANLPIVGEYTGRLPDNAGVIEVRLDDFPVLVPYDDRWHPMTDGHGFSLVHRDPLPVYPDPPSRRTYSPQGWRASSAIGGSPGAPEPDGPVPGGVVINEILARAAPPYEDAIELFNPTTNDVDISGWFLSDRFNSPRKFRLPEGAFVPAGGYLALDEHAFNASPGEGGSGGFELSGSGEMLYLFSADLAGNLTGYAHGLNSTPARKTSPSDGWSLPMARSTSSGNPG